MGTFFLQCMDGIQEKKTSGREWNQLLDALVMISKYKKSSIYYVIYIKVFSDGKVSYLTVSTDDVLKTTNDET